MLEDATYREWTKPFDESSHFIGDWSEGSKIQFLGSSGDGKNVGGMIGRIAKNTPNEYISIQHLGMIENGVEKLFEGDTKTFENYTLTEKDGGTELFVELINLPDSFKDMMAESWPKALDVIKALSEK